MKRNEMKRHFISFISKTDRDVFFRFSIGTWNGSELHDDTWNASPCLWYHYIVSGELEPAERALEPAGRASEPAGRALELAGRVSE